MRRSISKRAAAAVGLGSLLAGAALADLIVADDEIVQGSLCVGFDCVNGEVFAADTIRLKENNLRITFADQTDPLVGPGNDWTLTANDSASGGQSRFSIDDISAASVPFWIGGGAPSHSLFVSEAGRVGIGTDTPEEGVRLHVAGDLRIDGDLILSGGARSGSVPASEFAATRMATVTFSEPYTREYAIALTPVAASDKARVEVALVSRDAGGFTFRVAGKRTGYVEVLWATRWVGEL